MNASGMRCFFHRNTILKGKGDRPVITTYYQFQKLKMIIKQVCLYRVRHLTSLCGSGMLGVAPEILLALASSSQ